MAMWPSQGPSHTGLLPNLHPVVRPFISPGRFAPGTGLLACLVYTNASTTAEGKQRHQSLPHDAKHRRFPLSSWLAVSGVWTGPQLHWQHCDHCVHQSTRWSTLRYMLQLACHHHSCIHVLGLHNGQPTSCHELRSPENGDSIPRWSS